MNEDVKPSTQLAEIERRARSLSSVVVFGKEWNVKAKSRPWFELEIEETGWCD